MNYDNTKNKIRKAWEETEKQENKVDQFKAYKPTQLKISYNQAQDTYLLAQIDQTDLWRRRVYEAEIDYSAFVYGYQFYVELDNFPEEILPFVSLKVIYSSTQAHSTDRVYHNLEIEIDFPYDDPVGRAGKHVLAQSFNLMAFRAVEQSGKTKYFAKGHVEANYVQYLELDGSWWAYIQVPCYADIYLVTNIPRDMR